MPFLQESKPSLLIIGEGLFADPALALDAATIKTIESQKLPVVALKQEGEASVKLTSQPAISVPLDLFELFAFIQRQVENHPRQNLRLRLRLPGMYSIEEDEFILADVLNLSMRGLFFKAPTRINEGDRVTVVFPLFGRCKEIEIGSTVLYTIQPDSENNFFQGFGVVFDELPEDHKTQLQLFIREHFLKEVSASNAGVGDFTEGQLQD
jgi:hypothetical protein